MRVVTPLVRIAASLLLLSAMLPLQGCFTVAAVGIGATAFAIDDRRSVGIQVEDENIEWKARKLQLENFKDTHVNVTSFNLQMLLTGETPSEQIKKELGEALGKITSVKTVTNELVVAGNSALTARTSDTLTTASVKTRFIGSKAFASNHVKVVTEAGTVFLMGLVTREEGDAAGEIARTTSGVGKVVKVFEYLDKVPAKQ
jgi:osmotically-inducible protein OsmY